MNKRKKTQISEKQELRVPKAKKTPKRKTQVIRECDLEKPVEASDSSNTLLKATVAEAVQECKEHSLDNTTMEILGTDQDVSSAEESKKSSSERKVHAKGFLPPSQDTLESSEAECMVRNVPCDTAGKAIQNTVAPLELMDLLVTKQEDTGEQGILHSEERVDIKIQNKDRIITVNDSGALPGLDDSHEEAQKPTNTETNISEKQKMKSKKRVSFFLSTSHDKDAKSLEETEVSIGSLDHVISNQNEEMPEGPILQTKRGTKNRCDKLVPVIQQSTFDTCDLRPNEISETVFSREVDRQNVTQIPAVEIETTEISSCSLLHMDGKEETVVCGENKLVCMEGCLSSAAEVIPQPDGVVMRSDSSRESPRSEAQGSLLSTGTGSSIGALSSLDTMDQKCSPSKDPPSVDLEYLLDSQLEGNFESSSLEVLPHKPFSLDDPCAAEGAKSIVNVAHPNSARNEMMARICDPSKEEDATDVILGLIKELSNLNRLVMNTHRDLDSFRRLKFWKHRQSGKLLPHSMNTMTNMQCTVKKKKKMSLVNTMASFNICKNFLCSSDVSSAVTSKAVITHDREDV